MKKIRLAIIFILVFVLSLSAVPVFAVSSETKSEELNTYHEVEFIANTPEGAEATGDFGIIKCQNWQNSYYPNGYYHHSDQDFIIKYPNDPTCPGYLFTGWYTEAECITEASRYVTYWRSDMKVPEIPDPYPVYAGWTVCPHTWDNGEVTTEPTCMDGEKIYTCGDCGATKTEPIAATDKHIYDGRSDLECDVCGEPTTPALNTMTVSVPTHYISIPAAGKEPNTLQPEIEILDQFGNDFVPTTLTWYLRDSLDSEEKYTELNGVSIDPETGLITVPADATVCEMYVGARVTSKYVDMNGDNKSAAKSNHKKLFIEAASAEPTELDLHFTPISIEAGDEAAFQHITVMSNNRFSANDKVTLTLNDGFAFAEEQTLCDGDSTLTYNWISDTELEVFAPEDPGYGFDLVGLTILAEDNLDAGDEAFLTLSAGDHVYQTVIAAVVTEKEEPEPPADTPDPPTETSVDINGLDGSNISGTCVITGEEELSVKVNLKNNGSTSEELTVFLAEYDKNGKMISLSSDALTIAASGSASAIFTAEEQDAATIRIFAVDESMTPLTEQTELSVPDLRYKAWYEVDKEGQLTLKTNIDSSKWGGYSMLVINHMTNRNNPNHYECDTNYGRGIVTFPSGSMLSYSWSDEVSGVKSTDIYVFKGNTSLDAFWDLKKDYETPHEAVSALPETFVYHATLDNQVAFSSTDSPIVFTDFDITYDTAKQKETYTAVLESEIFDIGEYGLTYSRESGDRNAGMSYIDRGDGVLTFTREMNHFADAGSGASGTFYITYVVYSMDSDGSITCTKAQSNGIHYTFN